MTGIYSPETVIQNGIPSKKIRRRLYCVIGILMFIAPGIRSFFDPLPGFSSAQDHPAAFVFFDQTTNENLAIYRVAPSSFSNHLSLKVINRTEVDVDYVQLEIVLTNPAQSPFNFNPNHLQLNPSSENNTTPIKAWIEGELILNDFQIEAGQSVHGTFLYLISGDCLDVELKYQPIKW